MSPYNKLPLPMLPFPSAALCVFIFFLLSVLFTLRVNETLDEAKPIHLNPIVQTTASEDGASALPGTQATPAHLLGRSPRKGLIGERTGQGDGFNWGRKRKTE